MPAPKSYFCLPGSVYERCVDPAGSRALAACGLHNVLCNILSVVDADAPAFYFDVDASVVLYVLSNFPERRAKVKIHHIDESKSCVTVAVCNVMSRDPTEAKLIVSSMGPPAHCDLWGLCHEFRRLYTAF